MYYRFINSLGEGNIYVSRCWDNFIAAEIWRKIWTMPFLLMTIFFLFMSFSSWKESIGQRKQETGQGWQQVTMETFKRERRNELYTSSGSEWEPRGGDVSSIEVVELHVEEGQHQLQTKQNSIRYPTWRWAARLCWMFEDYYDRGNATLWTYVYMNISDHFRIFFFLKLLLKTAF